MARLRLLAVLAGLFSPLAVFALAGRFASHLLETLAYLSPLVTVGLLVFDEYYRRGDALGSAAPRQHFSLGYFLALGVWSFLLYKLAALTR